MSLFVTGADLSNPDLDDKTIRVTLEMVKNCRRRYRFKFETELNPLTNFILPGGASCSFIDSLFKNNN